MLSPARDRFDALGALLLEHRALYTARPGVHPLRWPQEHPLLEAWLLELSDEELERLEADPLCARAPAPYGALSSLMEPLCEVPEVEAAAVPSQPRPRRVRARKWQQVQDFLAASLPGLPPGPVVDWCAGKGHLGRTLCMASGRQVLCVEHQLALCEQGQALAANLPVQLLHLDALTPAAWAQLSPGRSAVALHACGQLGDTLLRESGPLSGVAFAPCCYHKRPAGLYTALSQRGREHALGLTADQLRLATRDEVHNSPARRALRQQERAWRFGVDALVREATGVDRHTPLHSMPRSQVKVSFREFVARAQRRYDLQLPTQWDPEQAERRGRRLARQARARSLLRGLFRAPLELWLFLDRVVYLEERGWSVRWGSFCDRQVSARSLLMVGVSAARPG